METLKKKTSFSRKFGKIEVTIEGNVICIQGEYLTNWGHFYPHMFELFKGWKSENAWPCPQVIGMQDSFGMHPGGAIQAWLYNKIKTGKLDHLIEEE